MIEIGWWIIIIAFPVALGILCVCFLVSGKLPYKVRGALVAPLVVIGLIGLISIVGWGATHITINPSFMESSSDWWQIPIMLLSSFLSFILFLALVAIFLEWTTSKDWSKSLGK